MILIFHKSMRAGEFYGPEAQRTLNLDLVARFFEKYPTYADKAFLSVKVPLCLLLDRDLMSTDTNLMCGV